MKDNLGKIMQHIGADMDRKDLEEIFLESDMKRDHCLDFDEFVVSLAIGYLLNVVPNFGPNAKKIEAEKASNGGSGHFEAGLKDQIGDAFDIVVDAYLMCDADASGTIKWDEMNMIMGEGNNKGFNSKYLNKERWKELDWDQNGTITFQEFLLGFEGWVGIEDD